MDFDEVVKVVVDAALAAYRHPFEYGSFVLPDWREGDPRWRLTDLPGDNRQVRFIEDIAWHAQRELESRRVATLKKLLDDGVMTRPQMASGLGVSLRELSGVVDKSC